MIGVRAIVLALGLAVGVGGCASPFEPAPYAVEITDQVRFDADVATCKRHALGYHAPSSLSSIGEAAAKGAGDNAAGAAVDLLVPALGALGAAGSAALEAMDVLSTKQRRVYLKCLDKKTDKDGSALVLEPEG